ncbi:ROK family protein [Guptibacillus algicola]|uniref:ROK family protein n=1 Tax=Guptibacillus algicola TaxID=225844 RepID=UPI001CD3C870|nr:ROK family protein [Alkalihalobacillus algicola]MCA0986897.1 ROK family protein [Alkalihalobacillus algicola]
MGKYYMGIDLGGTNLRVGVTDERGHLLKVRQVPTEATNGSTSIIGRMVDLIKEMNENYKVETIGIGSPGPLNPFEGIVLSPPNLPGWKDVHITEIVEKRVGVQTSLINDADAAALGEAMYGAGKGKHSSFYITVSTGVGGGYVINNKIVQGEHGYGAEIGNMIIKPKGPKHANMNAGSLEAMASGTAIGREGKARLGIAGGATEVFSLADEGNQTAIAIINEAIDALAIGIANLVHTVDPSVFILGGGVMNGQTTLFPLLREKVDGYIYEGLHGRVAIEPASLGNHAGLIGAAMVGIK